jgi:hypothetical protein
VILTPLMAPRANAHAELDLDRELSSRMPGLDADRLQFSAMLANREPIDTLG